MRDFTSDTVLGQTELRLGKRVGSPRNGSEFQDPAFTENRAVPIHRWVPWIAGFSASFVDSILATYLNTHRRRSVILDPFAGVGTTLAQAIMRGHDVIGFEINPYAALATRAKLNALSIDSRELDREIVSMREDVSFWRTRTPDPGMRPARFRSKIPFFSKRVECQVLNALGQINRISDSELRDLFRVAFGSVMVSFSNYSYEPSLSSRPGAGKPLIEDANVGSVLLSKMAQIQSDIAWLQTRETHNDWGEGRIYNEDFFDGHRRLEPRFVHLLITSPPYLNNYHYVRNTRPQLHWLSLIPDPGAQKFLEERNFGTYWQVARAKEHVSLEFDHPGLVQLLDRIRHMHPENGTYGGRGWANYAASYFNDCFRFLVAAKRILARNAVAVIVVGNSIIQGVEVRVDEILSEIAIRTGLNVDGIYRLRDKRVGDSITRSSVRRGKSRATLYESAVVVRKK